MDLQNELDIESQRLRQLLKELIVKLAILVACWAGIMAVGLLLLKLFS